MALCSPAWPLLAGVLLRVHEEVALVFAKRRLAVKTGLGNRSSAWITFLLDTGVQRESDLLIGGQLAGSATLASAVKARKVHDSCR